MTSQRNGRARAHAGFTIMELLVVTMLIVVLAGIGMAGYRQSVIRAKEAVLRENLYRMRDALDQYYADKQKYAPTLADLVTDQYLREIPKDPFTQSADTWQIVEAEPDPVNPSQEPGVYNVKSGSDQTALDGSNYADW